MIKLDIFNFLALHNSLSYLGEKLLTYGVLCSTFCEDDSIDVEEESPSVVEDAVVDGEGSKGEVESDRKTSEEGALVGEVVKVVEDGGSMVVVATFLILDLAKTSRKQNFQRSMSIEELMPLVRLLGVVSSMSTPSLVRPSKFVYA